MTVTFTSICSLLQRIENVTTRQPRLPSKDEQESSRQIISNWFFNQRVSLNDPNTKGCAILSALFPHRRKDRVYGLQAPLLEKRIAHSLSLNNTQRTVLARWRDESHGDIGACVERAMRPWDGTFIRKQAIPIEQVDQLLEQLAAKYRFSDEAIRKKRRADIDTDVALKDVLIKLESWEAKWFVRLIMRNHCTVELDETFVLRQYHFLLPDLLMFQNDFEAVFEMLKGPLHHYPAAPAPALQNELRIQAAKELNPVVGVKVSRPTFHKAWSFKNCFQLMGKRAWAAEVKYDGEYCEIHVDLDKPNQEIKIFSKNGKDATQDRQVLLQVIRDALRIRKPGCLFRRKCIVLGEMVLYSDREKRILSFSKIRKHVSRSGSFIGTLQDSLPHEWEHLMLVFFDVLVLDEQPVLRHCLQERRKILRELIRVIPGRSMRSEWTLVDFKTGGGITDLKQTFALNLVDRQEGLVLKPLHAPYFPLFAEKGHSQAGYFVKLKRDYLGDMGGERDLGDFAVIGASYDAQVAPKTDVKPLHWTHFYLGCCTNKLAVQRDGACPHFKVVTVLSLEKCISKTDLKYMNVQGHVRQEALQNNEATLAFKIEHQVGNGRRMTVAFKKPFVVEILGSGFEKMQNEAFEMLRHPRIRKIHHDRTWEDTVMLQDLERMAEEKSDFPDADKSDGHARDVALLVRKYARDSGYSQLTVSTNETIQQTTPRKTQGEFESMPSDAVVQETQQCTLITVSSTRDSIRHKTQRKGINASHTARILVWEDTVEGVEAHKLLTPVSSAPELRPHAVPTANTKVVTRTRKRSFLISPPVPKRRKVLSPMDSTGVNRHIGAFEYDSQEKTIHIFANEGVKVQVHTREDKDRRCPYFVFP